MVDGDAGTTTCARCDADLPVGAAFCPRCGAITSAVGAGPVIPGHTILRILGRGGAAVVYLARQDSLDREVAVKVLRREVEDPKLWRYFRREAQTIARLSGHPNVVTVYTAGLAAGGQPYLVTEYLERGSLSDVITAVGPLPAEMVVRIGIAVASALSAAHAVGIHHRDVKPGNVLLDQHGGIKLGDFGIARLLAGQAATTDVVAFTPEHVAPEILRGEPDGPGSDLYGLASTMAEALTGAPLFTRRPGERVESVISRRLMATPPQLPSTVPPGLAKLVREGLDPDPAGRPSLVDFRSRLSGVLEELHTPAPPPLARTEPMPTLRMAPVPSPVGPRPTQPEFAAPVPTTPARPKVPEPTRAAPAAARPAAAAGQDGAAAVAARVAPEPVAAKPTMVTPVVSNPASSARAAAPVAARPTTPLIGSLKSRWKIWAIPALLFALIAGTLTAAIAMNRDNGDESSSTTGPDSISSADTAAANAPLVSTVASEPATTPVTLVPATDAPTTQAPVTQPPTTQAPTTSAAPSTSAAPTTQAAPVTSPAPTPAPTTPTVDVVAVLQPNGEVSATEAETFLRSYYDALDAGNYELTWSQLAPEFQRGKANSYDYYVRFWNENDIEVGQIEFVDADKDKAVLDVDLRWNGNNGVVHDRFTLRRGDDGGLLIAKQDEAKG